MHPLPLLGVAALLVATSALGANPASSEVDDHSAREVATTQPAVTADQSVLGVADFATPAAVDPSESSTGATSTPESSIAELHGPTCFGQQATLVGTSRDDVIVGTGGKDVIVARAGNDVIRGHGGADLICGGPGNDRLDGGDSPLQCNASCPRGDRISGDEGDDRIIDGVGYRDLLLGGLGDDYLKSNPPRGRGPCCFGRGADKTLKGGPGADQLISELSADDDLRGGPGPDVLTSLTGAGESRSLDGGPGPDLVTVAGDGDILVSLAGDGDQLFDRGVSYLVLFLGGRGPIEADLAAGTVRLVGAAGGDVITHLAPVPTVVVYGSAARDRISTSSYGELVFGGAGNDILVGRAANDSFDGGEGDDVIDGGDGNDGADGGAGDDTCVNIENVQSCPPPRPG